MSRTSKAPDAMDPLVGRILGGRYTVKKIIGRGGVGLVYLANDQTTDRDVVVKVLAPQWSQNDEALARFEREAKRLSALRHPNIVEMIDYGHQGKNSYLVMEYLQGELLLAYMQRNGALTLEQFVPIAAQALKGIGHAHAREMMVRDIKPSNVMLCERKGRANFVKLLDFGLAKLIRGEAAITEEHVMGTVGYLSPEQIKGEPLDLRVDVYALGVMFYSMLAGRMPFEGDNNAAIFYKTVNDAPPSLRTVAPHGEPLPPGLVELIDACLAKNRNARPADADAIVERLIDAVPAALFRLPRAEGSGLRSLPSSPSAIAANMSDPEPPRASTAVPPGATMRVPADAADEPIATRETTAAPAIADVTYPSPPADTSPSTPSPADLGTGGFDPPKRRSTLLFGGVAIFVIGFSLVAWTMTTGAPPTDARAAAPTAAPTQVDNAAPPPMPSSAAADERVPADPPADAKPAQEGVASVPIEIHSRPLANLYIDGVPRGTTPFSDHLPIGTHAIRMTARGHVAWQGELDVRAEGTEPLSIVLPAKKAEPSSSVPAPPAVGDEPAPEPSKSSPFLPTKKSDKKSVFLPTKDP